MEIDGFRGRLIGADHDDYDIARAVWNGAIDRRPRLIARCIGDRRRGRGRAFRSRPRYGDRHPWRGAQRGGHRRLRRRDRHRPLGDAGRAGQPRRPQRLGAGWCALGRVDRETQAHGLATTGGIVSHTGVAGLTLGGGVGWLMRKHGLTVDNLLAVDVVTADGELLRVSEDEHPELFWALRGGGGNFGVVTSFEFRLHSVGPNGPGRAHPLGRDRRWKQVLRFYRDFVHDAPDELGTVVRFGAAPPLEGHPRGSALASGGNDRYLLRRADCRTVSRCSAGSATCRTPLLDLVGPKPYGGFQSALDSTVVHGWHYYWKSTHLPELRDDLHRRDRRARVRLLVAAVVRGAVPSEGGGEPDTRGRDGVREPAGVARDHPRWCVAAR